jgi:hypothetical protein
LVGQGSGRPKGFRNESNLPQDIASNATNPRSSLANQPRPHRSLTPTTLPPPRLPRVTYRYDFLAAGKIALFLDGEAQGALGPH